MAEVDPPKYGSADAVEEAFYAAFEKGDVDTMMSLWADDGSIACVHPVGPRLEGRDAIRDGWRAIFSTPNRMRFTITDRQRTETDTLAVHVLHENIQIGRDPKRHPPVVATNVYRLTDRGWRIVLHHASPTPGQERAEHDEEAPVLH